MPPFSSPWFWVITVVMAIWAMYGLVLSDQGIRPKQDGWFGALVGSPVHGRRALVIAVVCNLAAAGLGLNAWRLAPGHIYDLPLFHEFLFVLWAVCLLRIGWAVYIVGKPARRPSAASMLAFWGYVMLTLVVLMPMAL